MSSPSTPTSLSRGEQTVLRLLASGRYRLLRGPLATVKTPRTGAIKVVNGQVVLRASWKLEPTEAARPGDAEIPVRHPSGTKFEDLGLIRQLPPLGGTRRYEFILTELGHALVAALPPWEG